MNYNLRESINANSILSKVEAIVSKTKIKHPKAEIIELDGTKYIYYSYFDRGFDDDGLDMVWDKCSDLKGVVDVGFGYGYGLENTKYEDSLLIELDDDVIVESKKSARKSLKESKTSSILDDEFDDLIEQGYIYDEDENGMNMSYGEYVAVSDDLWEILENELEYYRDFPSAYDAYNEIMDNTSDDAKMFMGVSDDDYFYFEINEDENTYSFSGEVPTVLEKLFKKFLKETDFERV